MRCLLFIFYRKQRKEQKRKSWERRRRWWRSRGSNKSLVTSFKDIRKEKKRETETFDFAHWRQRNEIPLVFVTYCVCSPEKQVCDDVHHFILVNLFLYCKLLQNSIWVKGTLCLHRRGWLGSQHVLNIVLDVRPGCVTKFGTRTKCETTCETTFPFPFPTKKRLRRKETCAFFSLQETFVFSPKERAFSAAPTNLLQTGRFKE